MTAISGRKSVIVALALLVPALLLEAAGMSKFFWSPVNPVYLAFERVFVDSAALSLAAQALVVIGPALAIALAVLPIVRVNVRRDDSTLVSTVALRLSAPNLVVMLFGMIALTVIALYIVGENAQCILGYNVRC